jgi:hypothetical protein
MCRNSKLRKKRFSASKQAFAPFKALALLSQSLVSAAAMPPVNAPIMSPAAMEALHKNFPHLTTEQFRNRLGLVFVMFWVAASRHDFAAGRSGAPQAAPFAVDEIAKMATAALTAPTIVAG